MPIPAGRRARQVALFVLAIAGHACTSDRPDAPARVSARPSIAGFTRTPAGAISPRGPQPALSARVDSLGLHLIDTKLSKATSLRFSSFGRESRRTSNPEPVNVNAGRAERAISGGITEWFAVVPRGLEHGFDVSKRLDGVGELVLVIDVTGRAPKLSADASRIDLGGDGREAPLAYGELTVVDALGRSVPSRLAVERGAIAIHVTDSTATYPLHIDPLIWGPQRAELLAGDAAIRDQFGASTAVSGTTAVIGAPGKTVGANPTQGTVYVYVRTGAAWVQQAELTAADGVGGDNFGAHVAIDGDALVIGNTVGGAYVFSRTGTTWAQQAKLAGDPGDADFGCSVAISGSTVIVGAMSANGGDGAAEVFVGGGASWPRQAKLTAPDGLLHGRFGYAVAVSGDYAMVSVEYGPTGPRAGSVYPFTRTGTSWASHGGRVFPDETAADDSFGYSISMRGTSALIGAPRSGAAGSAYVFSLTPNGWLEQSRLTAPDGVSSDWLGASVAFTGRTALVGAPHHPLGTTTNVGAAYVFTQSGANWVLQPELFPADGATLDRFGQAVGLDDAIAFVGAFGHVTSGRTLQGAAYVFGDAPDFGATCSLASDCATGYCVDGVCCDTSCAGPCVACTSAKKGSGADGTCGPAARGTDPDGDCPGACNGNTLNASSGCNGAGACIAAVATPCAPYLCVGTTCTASCSTDTDCVAGAYCASGACVTKKLTSATCSTADECASGFCVDGVCCSSACEGNCMACRAALTGQPSGVCAPVPNGLDPRGACGATTCTSGTLTASVCNGAGACHADTKSCGAFGCKADGSGCAITCTSASDCAAGSYCAPDGTCDPLKPVGKSCTTTAECTSGFCVDGVCCESACAGQCQSCGEATRRGQCVTIQGRPRAPRADCAGAGDECGGACDGKSADACVFPPTGTPCNGGCLNGTIRSCDGAGACGPEIACSGGFACADVATCKLACSVDSDCQPGLACTDGACTAALPPPPPPESSSSGSCGVTRSSAPSGASAGAVLAASALLVRLARRRREDRDSSVGGAR